MVFDVGLIKLPFYFFFVFLLRIWEKPWASMLLCSIALIRWTTEVWVEFIKVSTIIVKSTNDHIINVKASLRCVFVFLVYFKMLCLKRIRRKVGYVINPSLQSQTHS